VISARTVIQAEQRQELDEDSLLTQLSCQTEKYQQRTGRAATVRLAAGDH
jgi:hypothetical protein